MPAPRTASAELRRRAGLDVLTWPVFDGLPVQVAVTTRQGGVSAGPYESMNMGLHVDDDPADVAHNRRRAAATVGGSLADLVFASQVHGRTAAIVTDADRGAGALSTAGAIAGADALVTRDTGPVLVVLVADCLPIVLYDPRMHVVACVHAGWRGTVARVAWAALAAMGSLGTRPADVVAALGPAIAADAYEVGDDVATAGEQMLGSAAWSVLRPASPGKWLFDLTAANRLTLCEAGVPADAIHVAGLSTGPDPGLFYSHRTEQPCGRFAVLARLDVRAAA